MVSWHNWSGRQRSKPAALHFVRSEADAAAIVREAGRTKQSIRVAGAGHSHAPLVVNDGTIVDTSGLAGVVSTDPRTRRAWVWSGTRIYALGRALHDQGLALTNQGDIDRQAIGGAVATGTHGTGSTLKNLSASVTAARIVVASGEIVECSAEQNIELFRASRLGLGAFGIVTQLELQLAAAYRLEEHGWSEPFDALRPKLDALIAGSRHFEFFWYPHTDVAVAKSIDPTDADPVYPLADEGARLAWSYEVLPNHRPRFHTEMEYSVPAQDGPACFEAIRRLIRTDFAGLQWPVEYRTLAADDVWLSTAYERPTVTISVHLDVNDDEQPYYRACEEIFKAYSGRPHWGKVNYLDAAAMARCHPRWSDWWKVRDAVDPAGTFLNAYLRGLSP
jgi:FAD/FMN-containing dehydrogenase